MSAIVCGMKPKKCSNVTARPGLLKTELNNGGSGDWVVQCQDIKSCCQFTCLPPSPSKLTKLVKG